MTVQPMTVRVTPETRREIKVCVATFGTQMQDFFEAVAKHVLSLPVEEISKILKK